MWQLFYTTPEREGSLSLGFLLFLCAGFFPLQVLNLDRVWSSLDSGYTNGIVHWLIENVTTEMTTNQTLQSNALLSTFDLYSLGKPWCLSSFGGTWCLLPLKLIFHGWVWWWCVQGLLHTSLVTGAYLSYYCLSVTLLTSAIIQSFWPRELPLTNIDFLFSQFPVNPRVGEKIPVKPVCEIHRGTNECKSPF